MMRPVDVVLKDWVTETTAEPASVYKKGGRLAIPFLHLLRVECPKILNALLQSLNAPTLLFDGEDDSNSVLATQIARVTEPRARLPAPLSGCQ
jgi:hypothetical protein